MTDKEKLQRQIALASCGNVCEICGQTLTTWQGAHKIANTKSNRKKWGDFIIDHPMNIAIVCSLKCNDACNIGYNKAETLNLIEKIIKSEKRKGGIK